MHGTLDDPPIIIEQDKAKITSLLVTCVAFCLFFGLLAWSGTSRSVFWGYVAAAIFGVGALLLIVQLVRPGVLIVDRDGLTCRLLFNAVRYRWDDIASFVTHAPNAFSQRPAFVLAESSKRHPISRKLTGGLGTLGALWELSASEIVDILNDAKARWRNAEECAVQKQARQDT